MPVAKEQIRQIITEKDIYGIEMSAEMVSHITDRIIPKIKEGSYAMQPMWFWASR